MDSDQLYLVNNYIKGENRKNSEDVKMYIT